MDKNSVLEVTIFGMMIGTILTCGSIAIATLWFGTDVPTGVEILAVWTSYVCTWLCVYQSRTNYYWGMISVALYAYLFYSGGLYGSAATQLYLSAALIYGWWRWGPDTATRPVRFTPLRLYTLYFVVTFLVWYEAVWISTNLGGAVPFWDGWILAGTILAQFLLDNKRIETWGVWVAVNLVAIVIYWQAGWILVTIQYVFFLANTLWGLYQWYQSYIEDRSKEISKAYMEEFNRRQDLAP